MQKPGRHVHHIASPPPTIKPTRRPVSQRLVAPQRHSGQSWQLTHGSTAYTTPARPGGPSRIVPAISWPGLAKSAGDRSPLACPGRTAGRSRRFRTR